MVIYIIFLSHVEGLQALVSSKAQHFPLNCTHTQIMPIRTDLCSPMPTHMSAQNPHPWLRPSPGGDSRPTSIQLPSNLWTLSHTHLNDKACKTHNSLFQENEDQVLINTPCPCSHNQHNYSMSFHHTTLSSYFLLLSHPRFELHDYQIRQLVWALFPFNLHW